ncbi:uncharacterized protein LOC119381268 [Rhipicephalus sanguineus]|uniref:uncharacterized protein LOC119381268 n=1 Tax=Rhipicephalus sanguineus TaxID=34632 RepID=UPI00189502A3|nr:uncharacterized protein LOC119381268 [Rhipicephalus sanguineus]
MPSPSPTASAVVSVPLYTSRPSLVPTATPQPQYPVAHTAALSPSLTHIVPDQSPSVAQVKGYAPPPPPGSKSQRRVSISERPSVTTFSPFEAASGVGGPAQAPTGLRASRAQALRLPPWPAP